MLSVASAWRQARWWTGVLARDLLAGLGRGKPLPPGTLGLLSIVRFRSDRFLLNRARAYGGVFKVLWSRKLTTCVVGFERGRRLLALHGAALMPRALEIDALVPKGFLRRMRGADHRRYRAAFLEAMSADLLSGHEPELKGIIRTELSTLARVTEPACPEQLSATLDRIAIRLLVAVGVGQRPGDPGFETLESQFAGLKAWVYPRTAKQDAAYNALRTSVSALATDNPGDVTSIRDSVLRRLSTTAVGPTVDDTALGNLIYMIDAGRYDVRSLFRWVVKYLSDHPDVVADLRRPAPAGGSAPALAEACVLETLRLDQAEALSRDVTEEIEFDGYRIPEGSAVRILLRESHRDPAVFPDPDEYRPCRFMNRRFGPDAYSPFGIGEHRCIAAPFVIRLSTWLVEELTNHFEWTIAGDGPRHYGRYHWEPSPAFAIALRPRGEPMAPVLRAREAGRCLAMGAGAPEARSG